VFIDVAKIMLMSYKLWK